MLLLSVGCQQQPVKKAEPAHFTADPATAARVHGAVRFTGKAPAAKRISMDAEEACEKLHAKPVYETAVLAAKDGALANAFVYVKTGLEGRKFPPATAAVTIDQRGCQFIPRVVAIRAGQTVHVKNSDPVSHNIHPRPQNNREWNQQQAPGAPDLQRRFGFPEVMIPVKCNIHSWMRSYIGVLDHPYFAVTGESGEFAFADLPPGEYTVAVWHETLGERTEQVTLAAKADAAVEFSYR